MSNNSVRYNSSVVINNINEWPVDGHLTMAYRLSTWPVGWEEDDTVRFFSDFDSFHRVHASIGLTLVCPLAWGLAQYELDTIAALTVDELCDAIVVVDHD